MPRFFKENFKDEPYIDGDDAVHMIKSLRVKTGEKVIVCDGKNTEFDCTVSNILPDRVCFSVNEELISQSEPDIEVTLCTGLLKGDKFEQVIKHSVELGVCNIQPLITENCVSRPDEKSLKSKEIRWQKIVYEAAGQCGRGVIPKVKSTKSFKEFLTTLSDFDLVLFFYERGEVPLGETLWDNDKAKKIAIITGPEGGFSPQEAEAVKEYGAKSITLGKRILRAETAVLAALTGVMLLTDNLE